VITATKGGLCTVVGPRRSSEGCILLVLLDIVGIYQSLQNSPRVDHCAKIFEVVGFPELVYSMHQFFSSSESFIESALRTSLLLE